MMGDSDPSFMDLGYPGWMGGNVMNANLNLQQLANSGMLNGLGSPLPGGMLGAGLGMPLGAHGLHQPPQGSGKRDGNRGGRQGGGYKGGRDGGRGNQGEKGQDRGGKGGRKGDKKPANAAPGANNAANQQRGVTGLHIDRIPIDTLTRDVSESLSRFLGMEVLHIEDKRGQKTVHCCAFAIVKGVVDFAGGSELQYELPVIPGVRSVPGTVDDLGPTPRVIRIQSATRRPENLPTPQPRCTLHIRVMTQRRHWAFGINGLTWAGLACVLELVQPGAARDVILVADDTSEKTSQAHPENFICGFFIECSDVETAKVVLETCSDKRVIIDRVPFRIAAEYTRKDSLRLYDKPPKLRPTKQHEFTRVKLVAEQIANKIRSGHGHMPRGFQFKQEKDKSPIPQTDELSELFKFISPADIGNLPKWYVQRLDELGWQQPIKSADDILLPFLKSINMENYYSMLSSMGASTYPDLAILDDELLLHHGMDKILHRRKLLQSIKELRHRVIGLSPVMGGLPLTGAHPVGAPPLAVLTPPSHVASGSAGTRTTAQMKPTPKVTIPNVQGSVGLGGFSTTGGSYPHVSLGDLAGLSESISPTAPPAPSASLYDTSAPANNESINSSDAAKMHNPAKMHRGRDMYRATQLTLTSGFDENSDWGTKFDTRWTLPSAPAGQELLKSVLPTRGRTPSPEKRSGSEAKNDSFKSSGNDAGLKALNNEPTLLRMSLS